MAAADPRRKDVEEGEAWKREAAQAPSPGSNYDRGEKQALALSRVLNAWNPLLNDGREEQRQRLRPRSERQRRLSNAMIADRIRNHLGRFYWPNDVQRAYDGELRMSHLRPKVVEAYCIALEHTDLESMTEAFYAAELKPPKVTKDALKLAIRVSEGGADSGRRSA